MRLTLAVPILAVCAVGCGSGSRPGAPSSALAGPDRLLIAQQVVITALGGVGGAVGQRDSAPLSGLACDKTCSADACTVSCPVDERLACPAGGSASDKGQVTGTLDTQLTGTAVLRATQTYAACQPKAGLTIDGAPSTTATGNAVFVSGQLADQQTLLVTGGVQYASDAASGACSVELRVTFSRSLHGSARGSACGEPLDVAF
jgi:hypothetical protein